MQQTAEYQQKSGLAPALLGVFTDYKTLCAPHVPSVRDVLEGKQYRYKVQFNNATFIFHHGCLMVQVVHDGMIRALPPFGLDKDSTPYLQAMPAHQMQWMEEFLTLPKSTLLFYFTLLKEVFKGYALRCRWEDPVTEEISWLPVHSELRPLLAEVGWNIR